MEHQLTKHNSRVYSVRRDNYVSAQRIHFRSDLRYIFVSWCIVKVLKQNSYFCLFIQYIVGSYRFYPSISFLVALDQVHACWSLLPLSDSSIFDKIHTLKFPDVFWTRVSVFYAVNCLL